MTTTTYTCPKCNRLEWVDSDATLTQRVMASYFINCGVEGCPLKQSMGRDTKRRFKWWLVIAIPFFLLFGCVLVITNLPTPTPHPAPTYAPQSAPTYTPPGIPERSPPAPQPWSTPRAEQNPPQPSAPTYAPPGIPEREPPSIPERVPYTAHLPIGAVISDGSGGHSFTATPGNTAIDISIWNQAQLRLCRWINTGQPRLQWRCGPCVFNDPTRVVCQ